MLKCSPCSGMKRASGLLEPLPNQVLPVFGDEVVFLIDPKGVD